MRNRILVLLFFFGLITSAAAQSGVTASTPPAAPSAAAQSSSDTTAEPKPSFPRYNFSFGGGIAIGRDDTASFVGNSPVVFVGVGRNLTKMFGVDAEYMYYNLNFKGSVQREQGLPDQSGHMQSFSLDGIVNVPKHIRSLGAYGILGVGFYDRHVGLAHAQYLPNGSPCYPAWTWFDMSCVYNPAISGYAIDALPALGEYMSSESKIAGGFNYGGGITYKPGWLSPLGRAKIFVEWRYHRAYQSDSKTIGMPITVGLRW